MSNFRPLSESVFASPQISTDDVAEAGRLGFTMIVNNRPDGEAPDQPPGDVIEAAARAAGMEYRAIPITHAGFSEDQLRQMAAILRDAKGSVLAYCRSGTRSTFLWALTEAAKGRDPGEVAAAAAQAGYDVASIRPLLDRLASPAGD